MYQRGLVSFFKCVACQRARETAEHIFYVCDEYHDLRNLLWIKLREEQLSEILH